MATTSQGNLKEGREREKGWLDSWEEAGGERRGRERGEGARRSLVSGEIKTTGKHPQSRLKRSQYKLELERYWRHVCGGFSAHFKLSNTRSHIPATNCTEIAVSCISFWGVAFDLALHHARRASKHANAHNVQRDAVACTGGNPGQESTLLGRVVLLSLWFLEFDFYLCLISEASLRPENPANRTSTLDPRPSTLNPRPSIHWQTPRPTQRSPKPGT
eukprot:2778741-Rhodomonas_salina.1